MFPVYSMFFFFKSILHCKYNAHYKLLFKYHTTKNGEHQSSSFAWQTK